MSQHLYPTGEGSAPMGGSAHAALTLHAMGERDRDWVLSRLPEAQASELKDLLAELTQLGIPADPALVGHGLVHQPEAGGVAALEEIPDDHLFDLLRQEPAGLTAHLRVLAPGVWSALLSGIQEPRFRESLQREAARIPSDRGERLRDLIQAGLLQRYANGVPRAEEGSARDSRSLEGRIPGMWIRLKSLIQGRPR